jgi:hypothetical protein
MLCQLYGLRIGFYNFYISVFSKKLTQNSYQVLLGGKHKPSAHIKSQLFFNDKIYS